MKNKGKEAKKQRDKGTGESNKFKNILIFASLFLASLLLSSPDSALSDEILIKATVDHHQIPLNQNAVLTVEISGPNVDVPEFPKIEGITAYPSGQSQNITIINGQMATSATYNYVLQPRTIGTFTIPPIQVKHNNKVYQTDPIQLEVIQAADVYTKGQDTSKSQTKPGGAKTLQNLVFSQAKVDKKELFLGEQLIFTYKFYRKVNLLDQPKYNSPRFTNFWVEDLPPEKLYYEFVNGERYVVSEISSALFPMAAGELLIEPAQITCRIPDLDRRDPFSVFDDDPFRFFDSDAFQFFSGRETTLKTDPILVKVKDLPRKGQPKRFSGVVGSYKIRAEIDKNKTMLGQPITLTLTLEGKGNIQALTEPKLQFGEAFKIYDSGHSNKVKKENNIVQGEKVFKKLLIPIQEGELVIPSVKFSFFDPEKRAYQTIRTESFTIQVTPGKKEPMLIEVAPDMRREIQFSQKDIHFIKTDFLSFRNYTNVPSLRTMGLSLSFPFAIFLTSLILSVRRQALEKNRSIVISKTAYRKAAKGLKALEQENRRFEQKDFYGGAEKILTDYLSKKLGFSIQGHAFNEIKWRLIQRNLDDGLIHQLQSLLGELHFARFASTEIEEPKRTEFLKHLYDLLSKLEKKL